MAFKAPETIAVFTGSLEKCELLVIIIFIHKYRFALAGKKRAAFVCCYRVRAPAFTEAHVAVPSLMVELQTLVTAQARASH